MSVIALLPAIVVLVGAVCAAIAVGRMLDEVQQLRAELARAGALQPLISEVGTGSTRLRLAFARRQRRR